MLGEEAAEARVDAGVTEGSEDSSGGETEFDLAGWTVAQRMELVERLVELHIPHRWEGPLLVVPTVRDDEVEALTDEAEGVDAEAEVIEPREAASLMFLAAQRMRKGKVSADQYGELLRAIEGARPGRPPFGVDTAVWGQILALADDLADAVAEDSDELESIASELYETLRPLT